MVCNIHIPPPSRKFFWKTPDCLLGIEMIGVALGGENRIGCWMRSGKTFAALTSAALPPGRRTSMDFRVQLDFFRGPLDLLLFLVRKHELDVCDLPVALVTDQ